MGSSILAIVIVIFLVIVTVFLAWFVFALIRALLGPTPRAGIARGPAEPDTDADGMNPGDYYNGPHGYSPMTGYPGTQYGSGFDPDAEWNHEHE